VQQSNKQYYCVTSSVNQAKHKCRPALKNINPLIKLGLKATKQGNNNSTNIQVGRVVRRPPSHDLGSSPIRVMLYHLWIRRFNAIISAWWHRTSRKFTRRKSNNQPGIF